MNDLRTLRFRKKEFGGVQSVSVAEKPQGLAASAEPIESGLKQWQMDETALVLHRPKDLRQVSSGVSRKMVQSGHQSVMISVGSRSELSTMTAMIRRIYMLAVM
jgi:hypothetical protein